MGVEESRKGDWEFLGIAEEKKGAIGQGADKQKCHWVSTTGRVQEATEAGRWGHKSGVGAQGGGGGERGGAGA